jgi:hypothetical protein
MVKSITIALIWLATVAASAQYPQKLPIDYKVFFAGKAIGSESLLEKGEYLNSTQDEANPIKENQWNRSGKINAVLEPSKLSFSNYADNNAGKAIILDPAIAAPRTTIYSLTSSNDFSGEDYYLGALVNITSASTSGDQLMGFDGNYTGNQQRGRVCVKSSANKGFFNLGLGWKETATTWSADLPYGTTILVVVKVNPSAKGVESASLFINPKIGGKEAGETIIASATGNADLKKIRSIYIRQRPNLGGKMAGLRFSNNWGDIVK